VDKSVFDKIMDGLLEAQEFALAVDAADISSGMIIHKFNSDGTVEKIVASDFWKLAEKKDAE